MKSSSCPDNIRTQYIVNKDGEKTGVILDIKLFNALLQELEDLYDIAQAEKIIEKKEKKYSLEEVENALFQQPAL